MQNLGVGLDSYLLLNEQVAMKAFIIQLNMRYQLCHFLDWRLFSQSLLL